MITNFTTEFSKELLGGDCNILSGMVIGNLFTFKYLIGIGSLMIVYKFVDVGIDKLIAWYKNRGKNNGL